MATYKVIQDIEAEDHILGPLSLRQFIYSLIAVFCLYICFICVTKHAPVLLIFFSPPAIFFGFLAFPFGKDQPTEVWALAKIRFLVKPHQRVWDQSGVKELVTVTVPKRVETKLTNGLSQVEVRSRLEALASTIDSRGWAIKNVNVNLSSSLNTGLPDDSDRLISAASMPQVVPDYDVQASDDILDAQSNPVAHQMEEMITASTQAHRQHIMQEMREISDEQPMVNAVASGQPAQQWFTQPVAPAGAQFQQLAIDQSQSQQMAATQLTSADEQALLQHIHQDDSTHQQSYSHLRTLQPITANPTSIPALIPPELPHLNTPSFPLASVSQQPTTPQPIINLPEPVTVSDSSSLGVHTPAILNLANNNDLNVATLARQATPPTPIGESSLDEVVISLH